MAITIIQADPGKEYSMKNIIMTLLLAATPPAFAADADVITKLDPAWQEMERRVTGLVGPTHQKTLLDMAYAQVAVDACPGLGLNNKAFDDAFNLMTGSARKDAVEQRRFENSLMTDFGVYTGLIVAESFIDKPGFCKAVDGIKARNGGPAKFWTAK